MVEDHRRTAFFGVRAIQCASVDLTEGEIDIELFKKSVRGTLQGAIRLDISVMRLVSGLTGKDSTMSVEEFFKPGSKVADTVTKHCGTLFINCREKPVCFYAQWSTHCRLAYRICLQRTFLSPYYTGGEVGGPPDVDVMDALQTVHDYMDKTVSEMRSQMTLRSEEEAMANFRATMKSAEKLKRYLRADSESLSMLLAKVTLTTCYGIPRKGEPGYISEDENEDPPERSVKQKVGKWNEVDPIGMVTPPHHTDPNYRVPDEGKCLPLDDESTPTAIGMEFSRAFEEIGRNTKESIDKDVAVEKEFFKQAEGKIPRRSGNDPVYEKTPIDIFEALPEELEVVPHDLFQVRSPRVNAPEPARPRIAPAKRAPSAAQRTEEPDSTRWRKQRFEAKGQTRDRRAEDDDDQRPRDREMPPPRNPPMRRVTTREETRLPHTDGEVLRVTDWPHTICGSDETADSAKNEDGDPIRKWSPDD